jgi:transglutaminase-like putative cysteine protease
MQRLRIQHLTEYRYPSPVTLQPHRLLLRPREGHDVRIETSRLSISPANLIRWHRDVFDNSVAVVHFLEASQRLSITSDVVIQHYEEAPLDFVVEPYAVNYPFQYEARERADLLPFQQTLYPNDDAVMRAWLHQCGLLQGNIQTYGLLDRLNKLIAGEFAYTVREEPGIHPPAQTLSARAGSCRDFATLFMEACRHLGLASRFVSGYLHAPTTEMGQAATHAWAEAYLPGPGWKGFDPTTGEVTGNRHIPVAVARHPEAVPPVAGSFIGPAGLVPTLTVNVQVNALAS